MIGRELGSFGCGNQQRDPKLRPPSHPYAMLAEMDVTATLIEQGMLLQSARGPIPNVAELVAGETIKGSWWAHPKSHAIFEALNRLSESPDVVRVRLVNGKVTLVHRRLWPALVRVADQFTPRQLAALQETHTASGAHRVDEQPFPSWVPEEALAEAARMSVDDAWTLLPACLRR